MQHPVNQLVTRLVVLVLLLAATGSTRAGGVIDLAAYNNALQFSGESIGDRTWIACASDWDGDALLDPAGCAPADSRGGRPGIVDGLRFATGSNASLQWNAAPFGDRFDILRGGVSALPAGDYGACQNARDTDLTDEQFDDADTPLPGASYAYLVRARNAICALAGSWGKTPAGTERNNANPDRCQ
jgi:hypothetical protein